MAETSPTQTITAVVPGSAAAATDSHVVSEAPFGGVVSSVSYTPKAAAIGDAINKRIFTLVNKGQTGAGTTVVATLDLAAGVNLVAFDEKQFTVSAVAGAANVVEGDILALVSTAAGTGVADPGGRAAVEITRSYA